MLVYQSLPEHLKGIPTITGISGFWRRVLAFLLDVMALFCIGYVVTQQNGPMYAKMGRWGCLVGYGIALAYFGIFNSSIGRGQTPGKRLVQIQVVGEDGQFISLWRSVLRAALLVSPHLLSPLEPLWLMFSPLRIFWWLASSILYVGILYLSLFNRDTRQGLHDLIARTCVVGSGTKGMVDLPTLARFHYAVAGALVVVYTGLWVYLFEGGQRGGIFKELFLAYKAVSQMKEVRTSTPEVEFARERGKPDRELITMAVSLKEQLACACSGKGQGDGADMPDCQCKAGKPVGQVSSVALDLSSGKNGEGYRYDPGPASPGVVRPPGSGPLSCSCAQEGQACACTYRDKPGCPCALRAFADRVALLVLENHPTIDQKEKLTVRLEQGYSIGIFGANLPHTFTQSLSPAQWRQRLTTRPQDH